MRAEHPPRGWYPYLVLFVSLFLIVTGSGSVYFTVAALKPIAADFGWARSVPSLALAFQYLGGGLAGVAMGYWLDRAGMARPACVGAILLGLGALLTYWVREAWQLYFICGVLMACAGPVTLFSTLTVNIQRWFEDRRGMAVGVIGGGQALAGAIWPLTFQSGIEAFGWRNTAFLYGVFVLLVMVPLSIVFLRPHPRPARVRRDGNRSTEPSTVPAPVAPGVLLLMLSLASIGCCVAMSLPIAHLLSHASDVGYTPADGARMISLMLLCAAASSMLVLGRVVARVGPLAALLVFSSVQALTLSLFPSAHSLFELYVVAICFGLGYGRGPALLSAYRAPISLPSYRRGQDRDRHRRQHRRDGAGLRLRRLVIRPGRLVCAGILCGIAVQPRESRDHLLSAPARHRRAPAGGCLVRH